MTNNLRHWFRHRQLLTKKGDRLENIIKEIIGVYSAHPSAALSLFARAKHFDKQAFYQLDKKQQAFRVPAMRHSVYWLSNKNAHKVMGACIPPADDPVWEKRYSQKGRVIPVKHYESWKAGLLQLLQTPMTASDIKKAAIIPDDMLKFVLNRMAFEGFLLRVGAKSLRSNIISYVTAEKWAMQSFGTTDGNKALIWLAGAYLRAFGPASIKDFQWWTGVTVTKAKTAMAAVETVDIGEGLLLLKEDLPAFESFEIPKKDSLDILPQWDTYTMGYAPDGRQRFVAHDVQQYLYGKLGATQGNGLCTVLVNGEAFGTWNSRFKEKICNSP